MTTCLSWKHKVGEGGVTSDIRIFIRHFDSQTSINLYLVRENHKQSFMKFVLTSMFR